jgi:hypothetical protein
MAKFTITTDNGDGEHFDEALEFANSKAATDDAQVALAEMARDQLPNGKQADFGVKFEDDAGKEIYRAALSFVAKTAEDIEREGEESDAAADEVASNLGVSPRE